MKSGDLVVIKPINEWDHTSTKKYRYSQEDFRVGDICVVENYLYEEGTFERFGSGCYCYVMTKPNRVKVVNTSNSKKFVICVDHVEKVIGVETAEWNHRVF